MKQYQFDEFIQESGIDRDEMYRLTEIQSNLNWGTKSYYYKGEKLRSIEFRYNGGIGIATVKTPMPYVSIISIADTRDIK